jgi:putative membrane protein
MQRHVKAMDREPGNPAPRGATLRKFASTLGIGHDRKADDAAGSADLSTRLAQDRTNLALQRTYLANERTLESWVRTALSMIGFGFTLGKIAQASHGDQMQGIFGRHTWSISGIAYFLVIVGLVALLGATMQHWIRVRQLHAMGLPRQFSIAFIVALLVAAVGIFAFTALVLEL